MKKSGFTLIELLAVIVILAIIALIATPIVMNTIEKSKKSAAERSADNYIDAVETAVATKRLDGVILDDGVYSIKENGNICIDKTTTCTADTEVKVEINGTKPASGSKVALTNGQVVATGTSLKIDNYTVSYNNNKLVAIIETGYDFSKVTFINPHAYGDNTLFFKDLNMPSQLKSLIESQDAIGCASVASVIDSNQQYLDALSLHVYEQYESDYSDYVFAIGDGGTTNIRIIKSGETYTYECFPYV